MENDIDEEEIEEEIFYLIDENQKVFDLFMVLKNYLSEYYIIDSAILLRLIDEMKLPALETLKDIPLIHGSYTAMLLEAAKHDSKEPKDQTGSRHERF